MYVIIFCKRITFILTEYHLVIICPERRPSFSVHFPFYFLSLPNYYHYYFQAKNSAYLSCRSVPFENTSSKCIKWPPGVENWGYFSQIASPRLAMLIGSALTIGPNVYIRGTKESNRGHPPQSWSVRPPRPNWYVWLGMTISLHKHRSTQGEDLWLECMKWMERKKFWSPIKFTAFTKHLYLFTYNYV